MINYNSSDEEKQELKNLLVFVVQTFLLTCFMFGVIWISCLYDVALRD
jgi:hypothetical protein